MERPWAWLNRRVKLPLNLGKQTAAVRSKGAGSCSKVWELYNHKYPEPVACQRVILAQFLTSHLRAQVSCPGGVFGLQCRGLVDISGDGKSREQGGERDDSSGPVVAIPNAFKWRLDHTVSLPSQFDYDSVVNRQEALTSPSSSQSNSQEGGDVEEWASLEQARATHVAKCMPRPARIILIRHGESEGNRDEGVYTSRPDWKIGLTRVGKIQSWHAGIRLKAIVGDGDVYLYHSPYLRAVETTVLLLKHLDPKQVKGVREEPRVAEQQFGNLRDIETIRRCKEERKTFGRFFYRFPDGEAGLDVYSRVTSFMGTLRRDHLEENCTVVIVTHGLALRLFLMRWFQWTVEQFEATHNPPNCGVAVMNRLPSDGRYRLTKDTLDMIGAKNAPTTTAIGRFMLRKQATSALLSNL